MKQVKQHNYLLAWQILKYQPKQLSVIESTTDENEEHKEIICPSKQYTPEEQLLKKDSFDSLSTDAREMILAICNGDDNILNFIKTPQKKRYSKKLILELLEKHFFSNILAQNTYDEIKTWTKTL